MQQCYTYNQLGFNGRLGNQLWQIAWLLGKKADGYNIYLDKPWEYQDFFCLDTAIYERPTKFSKIEWIDGGWNYFQDLIHFKHCTELVKEQFKPSELSYDYLLANYPQWFFDGSTHTTAIHCRRGDYTQNPEKFFNLKMSYYNDAIDQLLEETDTQFIVFSDDVDYIRKHFNGPNFHIVEGVESHVDKSRRTGIPQDQWDLFIMSFCDRHIIANSTFSWWGAFLSADTKVFYPSVWYGSKMDCKDSFGVDVKESWMNAMPNSWKVVETT